MDADCPNVALHCTLPNCNDHGAHQHPYSLERIKTDMQAELRLGHTWKTMEPMVGCSGVEAQLFRFLHPRLSYAFAAKATHTEDAHLLQCEHDLYEYFWNSTPPQAAPAAAAAAAPGSGSSAMLASRFPTILTIERQEGRKKDRREPIQVHVPVSCGIIEPSPENSHIIFPLVPVQDQFDMDPYNIWLLLSYHSLNLKRNRLQQKLVQAVLPASRKRGRGSVSRDERIALVELVQEQCEERLEKDWGVVHNDLHKGNMLWCNQLNALVLIDFSRADLIRRRESEVQQQRRQQTPANGGADGIAAEIL